MNDKLKEVLSLASDSTKETTEVKDLAFTELRGISDFLGEGYQGELELVRVSNGVDYLAVSDIGVKLCVEVSNISLLDLVNLTEDLTLYLAKGESNFKVLECQVNEIFSRYPLIQISRIMPCIS